MQPLAIIFIVLGGFVLRQVFVGRGTTLPTDARDLFVAVGNGDWEAASEVTGRRAAAPVKTGTGGGDTTPPAGTTKKTADTKGWAWQEAQLKAQFGNDVVFTSTTNHSVKTVSGNTSYHVKGEAVDIVTKNGLTKREVFDWLRKTFPGSAEIIYTPGGGTQVKNGKAIGSSGIYNGAVAAGHNDHVHWAYTGPWK